MEVLNYFGVCGRIFVAAFPGSINRREIRRVCFTFARVAVPFEAIIAMTRVSL